MEGTGKNIQILRMHDVMAKLGVSRQTVYRLMADESFPRSIKIGKRTVGWRLDEVERWITARAQHAA